MTLRFAKMNGAGNDFVVIDNREGQAALGRQAIERLCDRHRGIGGDGLLAVEPAANGADFRMRYYNADGGEAEMCGNGARCFARFAGRLANRTDAVSFETIAGVITAQLIGQRVRLQMSRPKDLALGIELPVGDKHLTVHFVNTGVPHAVVIVNNLKELDVHKLGSAIRWHEHFAPKGTNANFIQQAKDGSLAIRTYERGVEGETLACGTGVVAAALIAHQILGVPAPVGVRVRGGDVLEVGFERTADAPPTGSGPAAYQAVTLTGPADFVFEETIEV
jgi:diaminopimelate epimerase